MRAAPLSWMKISRDCSCRRFVISISPVKTLGYCYSSYDWWTADWRSDWLFSFRLCQASAVILSWILMSMGPTEEPPSLRLPCCTEWFGSKKCPWRWLCRDVPYEIR